MHEKALQQEFMKLISAMRRDGDLFVDAEYLAHALLECAQEAVKLTQHAESEYAAHLAISKAKKGRLCNG